MVTTPVLLMTQLKIVKFTLRSGVKIESNTMFLVQFFSSTHAHTSKYGLSVMASVKSKSELHVVLN